VTTASGRFAYDNRWRMDKNTSKKVRVSIKV